MVHRALSLVVANATALMAASGCEGQMDAATRNVLIALIGVASVGALFSCLLCSSVLFDMSFSEHG